MKQTDLFTDLPRGEQLTALRKLKLTTFVRNGRKVSGAIQKATLRAIDDHQGRGDCFASQATLADEVGCGTTAIGLAIAALIDQDLITADRPHRMAPNRHRVVWSTVFQLSRKQQGVERDTPNVSRDTHSVERDTPSVSPTHAQRVSSHTPSVSLTHAQRVQNAPLIETLTDHLIATRPAPPAAGKPSAPLAGPWAVVSGAMLRWGLKTATQACTAARDRGLSIELVTELLREAGGDREPERWEPGQLANWLTGRTPPPFDEAEAKVRWQTREAVHRAKADRIREGVQRDGNERGADPALIMGITFRRLRDANLERFATDQERTAAQKLDALDRRRTRIDKRKEIEV